MGLTNAINRPGWKSFLLCWLINILSTWVVAWVLLIVTIYPRLHASMVPYQVYMLVSLVPMAGATLAIQTILLIFLKAERFYKSRRLIFIGTPVISLLCLWLALVLVGGPDYFLVII